MYLSDLSLARRLEHAEALASTRFVEARSRVSPESGAQWMEVAGVYAMYDGPRSPSTQTFGLGLFQVPAAADLDKLEAFFTSRGAPVLHEVSPLADRAAFAILNQRGYEPLEFTSVMFLPLEPGSLEASDTGEHIRVRIVDEAERQLWAETSAQGWVEFKADSGLPLDAMLDMMRVSGSAEDAVAFLASWDGHAIAAGGLAIHDGVALLAGASTIPKWRGRGAQRALLENRLEHAARAGCDLAMMCAEPGSASQRNAERQGFRIAYTRIKWLLRGW